ncbi:MAG: sigma-70 family RNA polymerase sigma factor, partial [Bacteroidetes bacterium]|nr:sigma-70 family RNA polymerase sigma factor [Bacteroidota bacterium]
YKESHDPVFVGELFERYTHMVFLVCMKYLKDEVESEDISMQIFEKLIKDLKKYEVRKFKYWLYTVTKNQCLIHLEKKKRLRSKADEFRETEQGLVESERELSLLDEVDSREEQLTHLEEALQLLNEEQRLCLELFYLQQKSYQEVSELTGYDMKQVKSYIQNGKRNLKIHLSKMSA